MSDAERPAVHVVAGLLLDGERVFITRRPPGRHQGGLWEFPGGKVDPGEPPRAALIRELHEELGIEVTEARPYVQVRHRYDDLDILLDVWRVMLHRGNPEGREGQQTQWAAVGDLRPSDFPAADRPVLRRLQLPPLYVISDVHGLGFDEFRVRLTTALAAGARLVQLREPNMAPETLRDYSRTLAPVCRRYGAKLLLNADVDAALAGGADGVHLNSARLKRLPARPLAADLYVAASVHDAEELRHAATIQADFAVLAPVKPTFSHPDAQPLGWARFRELAAATPLPLYALGGMKPEDLDAALSAGAHGIALLSGIWGSADIGSTVQAVLARARAR